MSRREEVETIIAKGGDYDTDCLARTLADEVDYLRATRADRDATIDKLLAEMEPGEEPPKIDKIDSLWDEAWQEWLAINELYARACEIAGRVK